MQDKIELEIIEILKKNPWFLSAKTILRAADNKGELHKLSIQALSSILKRMCEERKIASEKIDSSIRYCEIELKEKLLLKKREELALKKRQEELALKKRQEALVLKKQQEEELALKKRQEALVLKKQQEEELALKKQQGEVFVLLWPPKQNLVFKDEMLVIGDKEYNYSEITSLDLTFNLRFSREGFLSIVVNNKTVKVIFDALEHRRLASAISKVEGRMKKTPQKNALSVPQAIGIIVAILLVALCLIFPQIAAGIAVVGGIMIFFGLFMTMSNKSLAGWLIIGGGVLAFIGLALLL